MAVIPWHGLEQAGGARCVHSTCSGGVVGNRGQVVAVSICSLTRATSAASRCKLEREELAAPILRARRLADSLGPGRLRSSISYLASERLDGGRRVFRRRRRQPRAGRYSLQTDCTLTIRFQPGRHPRGWPRLRQWKQSLSFGLKRSRGGGSSTHLSMAGEESTNPVLVEL